ncbi:histone-fold-containing protein, partial [Piedraia hortae CBS 480.64]
SRSDRAGVIFPVGHVQRNLRKVTCCRIHRAAPVFLAAVLQYLVAEVLEIARNNASLRGFSTLRTQHIPAALGSVDFSELVRNVTFARGGQSSGAFAADALL